VEVGGSKSVVFCGGSTYKVCMCLDYYLPFHGDLKKDLDFLATYRSSDFSLYVAGGGADSGISSAILARTRLSCLLLCSGA
jgi:hypothetical protein